jgi:hypothetical protein
MILFLRRLSIDGKEKSKLRNSSHARMEKLGYFMQETLENGGVALMKSIKEKLKNNESKVFLSTRTLTDAQRKFLLMLILIFRRRFYRN